MSSGHHHHLPSADTSDVRLVLAVIVNVLLTVAQIVGGVVSGSLSLIADALHNLNDAASLGIALIARRIARKPADQQRTFGYQRAEVIGALINVTALVLIGVYLVYEAIACFFDPMEVQGWIVIIVAGNALVVDLITAALTYSMSKGSLNIRAAFVHNVADALGSVAVICVGTLILLFDFYAADLIATLVIASYMLYQGFKMMSTSIHILMESVPADLNLQELIDQVSSLAGVQGMHHVHVWNLDEHRRALEAHIVIDADDLGALETIKQRVKSHLADRFDVNHSTVELEPSTDCDDHHCPDANAVHGNCV